MSKNRKTLYFSDLYLGRPGEKKCKQTIVLLDTNKPLQKSRKNIATKNHENNVFFLFS